MEVEGVEAASELAEIRLGDLDLAAGTLRVRGKGSQRQRVKWRTVGMGVLAQREVQQYAYRYRPPAIPVGEDRVFLTREGRGMTRHKVHRFVKVLGQRAGVARAHPHLFRHSTGVAFLRSGGSESVLQRILGHSSREMVEHYMHLADTDVTQLHRRHSPLDHLKAVRSLRRPWRPTRRLRGPFNSSCGSFVSSDRPIPLVAGRPASRKSVVWTQEA